MTKCPKCNQSYAILSDVDDEDGIVRRWHFYCWICSYAWTEPY
jgi:hypothetical protein